MKIMPMMSKGVVLVHDDQTIEMAPMQVWRAGDGGVRIRIGRNLYFFDRDGKYDGSEHRMAYQAGSDMERIMNEALMESGNNKGLAPEVAHYPEDTKGYREETAAWPEAKHIPDGSNYTLGKPS